MRSSLNRSAFTLIELLVVIAIIALLIGLLIAVLVTAPVAAAHGTAAAQPAATAPELGAVSTLTGAAEGAMSKVLEHGLLLPIIMGAIVVLTCAMRLASKIITAQMASSEKTAEFTRTMIKDMHARYMEVTRASGQAAAPPPPPGGVPAGHQPTARTEEEIIQMAEVLLLLRQRRAASEKGRQASGAEFVAGNGHLGANFHSGGENI